MLELPKRFHPDFSRPKVKPSGLVEIDWSNPLTRGLTKLTLVDVPFELVNNKNITLVGTQLISADRSGKYRNFGGGNNLYVSTGAPHNGSMTLFAVAKPTSFPINGNLIGCDSDSSGLRSFQFRVTTGAKLEFIPFVANVAKFITGTTSLSASTTYSLAATYDQNLTANTAKVFIDGKQDAALNITGACDTDAAALAIAARLRLSNGTTPTEWFNGNIYFAACWDRPLTAEEIKSLADDPYQILKPANDLYYFPAVGVGGSTVEAAALYSNISSMLSGKIGTLNASVDISSGYTDVDAGDVNYNVFSNFNTVTNYSSPSGSIVEVSTTFSTSSDMGNAPVSDVVSLVDFNTILNSTSLANIIANATLVNSIQSGFVVDRDCILNDSILFNISSNYISTTGDTGVSAIAAITSAYSMLAGNYALTGAGISSVLSSIAQSVGISNQFAGIVDANNVSVLASGGQTNSSNCSFSLSSSDASISSISIEAIADYSTSLNLLCAVVSNMEASADYMSVANLISSNLSILNAQSSFGISSDLSVTRTMTTSAGATISVTCGYTTSGIQFTSTEVLTPDNRMVRVLSEGRIIRVLA